MFFFLCRVVGDVFVGLVTSDEDLSSGNGNNDRCRDRTRYLSVGGGHLTEHQLSRQCR